MKAQAVTIAFILGVFVGLIIGAKSCSTHTNSITKTTDTLYLQKPAQYIEGKTKFVNKYVKVKGATDTVFVPVEKWRTDTTICMDCTFSSDTLRMYDSAKIVAKFRPSDLSHSIWYQPAPEKIIMQTIKEGAPVWSLGVSVGYGLIQIDDKVILRPNLSLSIQRNLIGF